MSASVASVAALLPDSLLQHGQRAHSHTHARLNHLVVLWARIPTCRAEAEAAEAARAAAEAALRRRQSEKAMALPEEPPAGALGCCTMVLLPFVLASWPAACLAGSSCRRRRPQVRWGERLPFAGCAVPTTRLLTIPFHQGPLSSFSQQQHAWHHQG